LPCGPPFPVFVFGADGRAGAAGVLPCACAVAPPLFASASPLPPTSTLLLQQQTETPTGQCYCCRADPHEPPQRLSPAGPLACLPGGLHQSQSAALQSPRCHLREGPCRAPPFHNPLARARARFAHFCSYSNSLKGLTQDFLSRDRRQIVPTERTNCANFFLPSTSYPLDKLTQTCYTTRHKKSRTDQERFWTGSGRSSGSASIPKKFA